MPFVQNIDLAKVLQGAQALSRMRMDKEQHELAVNDYHRQVELARKQQEMAVKVRQAQAKVMQAQQPEARQEAISELQALSPETAISTQEQIQGLETKQQTLASKRRDLKISQSLKGAEAMQQLLPNAVQQTDVGPQVDIRNLFAATSRMQQLAQVGIVDQGQADAMSSLFNRARQATIAGAQGQLTGEQLAAEMQGVASDVGAMLEGAQQGIELLGDPEKRARFNAELEQIGGRAFELAGGENDYEWQVRNNPEAITQARKEMQEARLSRAKAAGTTIVNRMGQEYDPATRGARTAFQKDELASLAMLSNLKAIDVSKAAEFQTVQAGVKRSVLNAVDALGLIKEGTPQDEWLGMRRVFREKIDRVFNQYRREVTGAQAAFVELERLKDSILNADLRPSELRASYRSFVEEIERVDRIRRRVLRKGFNVSDPESFGQAMDAEYARDRGVDYAQDIEPVIADLRRRNPKITDQEIDNTLEALGF